MVMRRRSMWDANLGISTRDKVSVELGGST